MLEVRIRSVAELDAIKARLANPGPILAAIGVMMASESKAAFQLQRFGDIPWAPRYPNQASLPFVNIAGVVADFAAGATEPSARRFKRRPAAVDTGTLQRSISHQTRGNVVEIGSSVPYASAHNAGLVTAQPITESVRSALAAWLKTIGGKPYRKKLGFLFSTEVLETQVVRRPFLGLTDKMRAHIPRAIERWIAMGGVPGT